MIDDRCDLTAHNRGGTLKIGQRILTGDVQLALQQRDAGGMAIHHLYPAAGAAHAGHHGGGADRQRFIRLQRRSHVEKDLPREHLQLQHFAGLKHRCAGGRIQFDRLGLIQTDIGITGFLR